MRGCSSLELPAVECSASVEEDPAMAVEEMAEIPPHAYWRMIKMLSLAIILKFIIYLLVLKLVVFLLRGDQEEAEENKEAEEKSDEGDNKTGRIQDQYDSKTEQYSGSGASNSPIRKCVGVDLTQSTTVELSVVTDFHNSLVSRRFAFRLIIVVAWFMLCTAYLHGTQFESSDPEYYSAPDTLNNEFFFKNYNPLERAGVNHPKEANEEPSSAEFHGNENVGKVLTLNFQDDFEYFPSEYNEQFREFNDEKQYRNPFAPLGIQEDILEQKEPSSEDKSEENPADVYVPPVDKFSPTSAESQDLKAVSFPVENNSRENIEHYPFAIILAVSVYMIAALFLIVIFFLIVTNLMLICYIFKNYEQQ